MNISIAWWNLQDTVQHSSCGGVTYTRWKLGVIKGIHNPEPNLMAMPQWVVVQIIDCMIRGKHMKPEHSVTKGKTQCTVVGIHSTMYSSWVLQPTYVTNDCYVFPVALQISPTGYLQRHLKGHGFSESRDLPLSIIDETSRKIFRDWQEILT